MSAPRFPFVTDVVATILRVLDAHRIGWPAVVGPAGMAVAALGLSLRATATAEIGFAILAGATLCLVFSTRRGQDDLLRRHPLPRVSWSCTAAVAVLLAVCTALGCSAQVPPQAYFVMASASAGLIALQVAVAPLPQHRAPILIEIVLLSLLLRAVLMFAFPSLTGTDTWLHAGAIDDWRSAGGLVRDGIHWSTTYYSYPVTYLQTIAVQLVSSADVRLSMFLAISVPLAFTSLTVYCIGRTLAGERAGLLAALAAVGALARPDHVRGRRIGNPPARHRPPGHSLMEAAPIEFASDTHQ